MANKIIRIDPEVLELLRKTQGHLQARSSRNVTLNDALRFRLWPNHPKGEKTLKLNRIR